MISPTQFTGAATQRLTTTVPVWESRAASPRVEFSAPECTIVGDVTASARSLTVEQHTERVLVQLLGQRDATV